MFQIIVLVFILLAPLAAAASSFGGVNHYFLAAVDANTRQSIIQRLHQANVRVIRTFVRQEAWPSEKGDAKATWPDVENPVGNFNSLLSTLDHYDDMLHDVYTISNGQMKVLLSLHDGNMIATRGSGTITQPGDAYWQYMQSNGMSWTSFYSDGAIRQAFKNRMSAILNKYGSKNFGGRSWSSLSEVILAIDLENEPGVAGNQGAVYGTGWICDIATHLKNSVRLQGIGVATGAIGGAEDGGQNWHDEVFQCGAIDIVSIHGYYSGQDKWCSLLGSSSSLVTKARQSGKLVMAEEWVNQGGNKPADIAAQGHALNALGIPWTYWDVMTGNEGCQSCGSNEVSLDGGAGSAWAALQGVIGEASRSPSNFDWSRFLSPIASPTPITDGTCGNSGGCTWGCLGWNCDAKSPCQGDNECANGICGKCTWGCQGWNCNTNSPCKDTNECFKGVCRACTWGCLGWQCSASQPCAGENECVNGVCKPCTWGCLGWQCSSSSPCKLSNQCDNGLCKPCSWGCPGWSCSASQPCQGDGECTNGACGPCSWGCLGWSCSASQPCKGDNECVNGVCKPCSWGCRGWSCNAGQPCKAAHSCQNGVCA
jgi:hypothetical protein